MRKLFLYGMMALFLAGGGYGCAKDNCPANGGSADSHKSIKKMNKRKKPQSGLFDKSMDRKRKRR